MYVTPLFLNTGARIKQKKLNIQSLKIVTYCLNISRNIKNVKTLVKILIKTQIKTLVKILKNTKNTSRPPKN